MPIFDSHCHLNLEPLFSGKPGFFSENKTRSLTESSWQQHWQQAQNNGIKQLMIPGTNLSASHLAVEIAQTDPHLHASVAIAPHEMMLAESKQYSDSLINNNLPAQLQQDFQNLATLATNSQVRAIGETGLDYFRLKADREQTIARQKKLFVKHIDLANQLGLPLVIHARDDEGQAKKKNRGLDQKTVTSSQNSGAYWDVLAMLDQYYQFQQPFILHCVSGPAAYVQQAVEMGGYVSFAGNVTYHNAHKLRSLVKIVPADRILIETDAPFLPPQSHRGEICRPAWIKDTAQYLETELALNLEMIYTNTCRVFRVESK